MKGIQLQKTRILYICFLVLPCLGLISNQVEATIFYVSANGNDSWSGQLEKPNAERTDGPFATLEAACLAAKKVVTTQPRKVVIQTGHYFLDKPLTLA